MNKITANQIRAIELAHADGLLDNAIATRAGVSVATVKRYRKAMGLETNCLTTLRGREGERRVKDAALLLGMTVVWRKRDNAKHDLTINGQRVDVKAAMEEADGSWRFSLPRLRTSYYGRYVYTKDYERDCEAVALVCLRLDGGEPSIYLMNSIGLPKEVRIHPGQTHQEALEAWHLFSPAPAAPVVSIAA